MAEGVTSPEYTGQGIPVPKDVLQIFGGKWIFSKEQWYVVCRCVLRAMFAAGPPTEPDNVTPPPVQGDWGTLTYPPPGVVDSAAMLVNALILDPYKIYGSVPWGQNIHWPNYACLATWFHWLSDQGKQMFCADVKAGNVNKWLPPVRDIAMATCPQGVYADPIFQSANSIVTSDANPWSHDDVNVDVRDNSYVDEIWQQARIGTVFQSGGPKGFFGSIPQLPASLFCQPFPKCLLEQILGTGANPAAVNPVSGRVEYKDQTTYAGTPDGVDPKTAMPKPYNWFLGPVAALAGGSALYGLATLFGAGRVARIAAGGAGVAAGAVIGGRI